MRWTRRVAMAVVAAAASAGMVASAAAPASAGAGNPNNLIKDISCYGALPGAYHAIIESDPGNNNVYQMDLYKESGTAGVRATTIGFYLGGELQYAFKYKSNTFATWRAPNAASWNLMPFRSPVPQADFVSVVFEFEDGTYQGCSTGLVDV